MADPYIAQMMPFGGNFAIRGWATCEGQLLDISSHTALFSLVGTTYGGDGRTTFGLPELRGRSIVGQGNGPGLPDVRWGEKGGDFQITLSASNVPAHTHPLLGVNQLGDQRTPGGNAIAGDGSGDSTYKAAAPTDTLRAGSVGNNTGGGQPFNSRNPYLGIYYLIALVGIFPSRS